MVSHFSGADVYAIDPLIPYDDNDLQSNVIKRYTTRRNLAKDEVSVGWARALAADQVARGSACRYHMVKEFSTVAANSIPGKIDFAFIDGLHTYEGVVADIAAYYPRMARGGVLMFNDYGFWTGVTRAVDEFVAREGLSLVVGARGVPPGHSNAAVVL